MAVCLRGIKRLAPPIRRCGRSARDILTLGFAKKAIGSACSPEKPGNVLVGVIPQDASYWLPSASPAFIGRVVAAAACCNASIPFTKCHGKAADAEGVCERNTIHCRTYYLACVYVQVTSD